MSGPLPPPPFFAWSRIVTDSTRVDDTSPNPAWDLLLDFQEMTHDPETGEGWPEPITARPDRDELLDLALSGLCPATDGCEVEADGICEHGHPAWTLRMGVL